MEEGKGWGQLSALSHIVDPERGSISTIHFRVLRATRYSSLHHTPSKKKKEREAYLLRDDLLSRSAEIDDKDVIPATHNIKESRSQNIEGKKME